MNREVFIMRLATRGVPEEEALKQIIGNYELELYRECVEILAEARREGRQIMLYTPND